MSDKIQSQHLERKAILYVRQSSSFQVQHNEESRKLQYAMQQRLHNLGWEQVDVIDEDLGRSAAGGVVRSGFERMVADVCLGKVGAVAAREVSRFARNSRDWQKLVEVCRVVDTLLIDQETIYAPRQSNDRLLLGLKGSLNEYELDLLRQRSVEARYEKAKRGELIVAAPVGYLKTGTSRAGDLRLEKDPNARVREAMELAFSKCFELGSVRQSLMWWIEQGLQLPVRNDQGELTWKRPTYAMLYQIVTNPVYGGAYVYGRTEHKTHYQDGKLVRTSRRKAPEKWIALIPDHHEGYVAWENFEQLQEMIAANNLHQGKGAARAQRQFDAADPENRLVTAELERRWNVALERVAEVESRTSRHQQQSLSDEEIQADEFSRLAKEVEAVWNDPAADIRLKKRIVRTLIEDIIADLDHQASEVVLTIHWVGGVHTELRVPRRRRGTATATPSSTVQAIRVLALVCSDDVIAGFLNRNGLVTGRGNRWSRERVTSMRQYHKIACYDRQTQQDEGWLNLTEAAKILGVSNRTLRLAIERGDIEGEHPLPDGPWLINRGQLATPRTKRHYEATL